MSGEEVTAEADKAEEAPHEAEHTAPPTAAQQQEAKQYGRLRLTGYVLSQLVDFAFMLTFTFLLARPLDNWLASVGVAPMWLRLLAFAVILGGLNTLVTLPLTWWKGYWLEHRFKLSRQSMAAWLRDRVLQLVLATVFGLAAVAALYGMIWYAGPYWWLAAAGATFAVSVLLGQLMPVLILPLFYKVVRLEDEELERRFERLAAGTGLQIEGVYRMEMSAKTSKANAMLAGLGSTRRVILGDTLLDKFSPDEIEVVLAHEVGHHVYKHLPIMVVMGLFASAASFFLCDVMLRLSAPVTEAGATDYANLPVYFLPAIALVASVFSLLMGPLQNTLMRFFERQCDRYALNRTGLQDAYRSAFRRLAQQNKSDLDPHWLEVALLHDHPPVEERIAMADDVATS